MAVVEVVIARVGMPQRRVEARLALRLPRRCRGVMRVPMLFIVKVPAILGQRLVEMPVLVPVGQVQPHPQPHEHGRRQEAAGACAGVPSLRTSYWPLALSSFLPFPSSCVGDVPAGLP